MKFRVWSANSHMMSKKKGKLFLQIKQEEKTKKKTNRKRLLSYDMCRLNGAE